MKTIQSKTPQPLFTFPQQLPWVLVLGFLICAQTHAAEEFNINPDEAPDSCDADLAQIRVTVNGVQPGGVLNVELYHDPEHFLFKRGRTRKVRAPATEEPQKVCINLEQPGTYAVSAYHDLDGNRKLRKRWNLLPNEPFGLSNNPEQQVGFPEFSDSAFTTTDLGADIVIDLKQP